MIDDLAALFSAAEDHSAEFGPDRSEALKKLGNAKSRFEIVHVSHFTSTGFIF